MFYDESIYEDFKKKVEELGYVKVFKMLVVINEGVDVVMKEVVRMFKEILIKELEIVEDERYILEDKKFIYEIFVEKNVEEGYNIYVIEGIFVDRLLSVVNVNDVDLLRYFYKVFRNKGIFDEIREMGIKDGDMVRLNDFEFEYVF